MDDALTLQDDEVGLAGVGVGTGAFGTGLFCFWVNIRRVIQLHRAINAIYQFSHPQECMGIEETAGFSGWPGLVI